VEYYDPSVGIPDPLSQYSSLHVYPNPAQQMIYVNLGNRSENTGTIELFDIHGKVVFEEIIPPAYQVIQLDIDQLHNGLYLLRWSETGQVKGVSKFVLNR
jgi:hypothetical protein